MELGLESELLSTAAPPVFTVLCVLFLQDSAETSSVDYDVDIEALPGLVDQSLSVMTRRVELSTREYEEANKMSTPPGELIWQNINIRTDDIHL